MCPKNVKRGGRGVDTWMGCMPWMDESMHGLAVKTMLCFALPLRLPLRQGRGVGGYIHIRGLYCQLGDYMLPTTFFSKNLENDSID